MAAIQSSTVCHGSWQLTLWALTSEQFVLSSQIFEGLHHSFAVFLIYTRRDGLEVVLAVYAHVELFFPRVVARGGLSQRSQLYICFRDVLLVGVLAISHGTALQDMSHNCFIDQGA